MVNAQLTTMSNQIDCAQWNCFTIRSEAFGTKAASNQKAAVESVESAPITKTQLVVWFLFRFSTMWFPDVHFCMHVLS